MFDNHFCIVQNSTLTIDQIKQLRALVDKRMIENNTEIDRLENDRFRALVQIGNIVHSSVPISANEVCIIKNVPTYIFRMTIASNANSAM
jgi:seryl-tRNA synthetase